MRQSADAAIRTAAEAVLCWDIDGTLLTTARAGIGAWEQALAEISGLARDLDRYPTAGLTDVEIAQTLLREAGRDGDATLLARLVHRYEEVLPVRLHDRRGHVLPGVREFLDWNRCNARVPCILLTGNTEAGGLAKLRHYGLAEYFAAGSFSSLEAGDRVSVARRVVEIAAGLLGERFAPGRMVVIGDTPHDVACGRAVGARTVAVATGTYGVAELEAAGAWRTLPALPQPPAFFALLG